MANNGRRLGPGFVPQFEPLNRFPPSPLVHVEKPALHWKPGRPGGKDALSGKGSLIEYIKSKAPGLAPHGWKDITPYWGPYPWPKSFSTWRTSAAQHGFYIKISVIEGEDGPYRAILVCLNPVKK